MALTTIAGVDEVGRGPLAGPVVAAAVILPHNFQDPGLRDSKKLSEKKRELFFDLINEQAIDVAIAEASVEEIDQINILRASLLAMRRAVGQLSTVPSLVQVDGKDLPNIPYPGEAIIGGDDKILCISAASIIAKVTRDRLMMRLGQQYPAYGFEQHKGYGTAMHKKALAEHGITPIHRKSFAPIKALAQHAP
jgi:ribonuclease HII